MSEQRSIVIARRFRGPAESGNGGYVCGLVANALGGAVEVTLRAPLPLETPLTLETSEASARLLHGDAEIATAKRTILDISAPPPIALAEAEAARGRYIGVKEEYFQQCFVCGRRREEGDGLRIFAGPDATQSMVAAPWTPLAQDCDSDGRARPEILWAALDCPGLFGLMVPDLVALLGRMAGEIHDRPNAGETCIVTGWRLGQEGSRKYFAGAAIRGADGRLLALAKTTWIEMPRERLAS